MARNERNKRYMKKDHIIYYMFFATFVVSFISLGVSCGREEWRNGMDYLGVIVGILALLVTVLIGLQLYNYIYARENISSMMNEAIRKMVMDYEYITKARDTLMNSYDFVVVDYNAAKIADGIMEALKETNKCGNVEMKNNSLNHIMDDAHKLCVEYSENGKQIKAGKRMEYLYILNHLDHLYKEELKKYVEEATEVEV